MNKKEIRKKFKDSVFKRDKYTCMVCDRQSDKSNAYDVFDCHHITDRGEIINGGYVMENGITVCKVDCHFKVEMFHIYEGEQWEPGLHPSDLYNMIGSSYELAVSKSTENL